MTKRGAFCIPSNIRTGQQGLGREAVEQLPFQVEIENSKVRVTRWTLSGGEETGLHLHEHDYVVVPLARGRMLITGADGSHVTNELTTGASYFRPAGARHNVSNPCAEVVDFIEVELLT